MNSPAITAYQELMYLRAYFVFAFLVYSRWAMLVINAICGYLGISCLSIPYTPPTKSVPNGNATNGKKREA